jgi:hypothetical protein
MSQEMSRIKETASAHLRRDMRFGGKWICECEACLGFRSLVGFEKALDVRSLVREIQQTEDDLHELPDGDQKSVLLERYFTLYDRLANLMAE